MAESPPFETRIRADAPDAAAPDGSEIRLLCRLPGCSTVHCALPPGGVSRPVAHRTVAEVWYGLAGEGEVWRRQGDREEVVAVRPGVSLTLPLGTAFQFRNTGVGPFEVLIVTVPPWPGDDEAFPVTGPWPAD